MKVIRISKEDWKDFSENLHKAAFQEIRSPEWDRIDFAIILVGDDDELYAYGTFRETDPESVYWQFGGRLPHTQATFYTLRGYQMMIDWVKERYKRVTTLIENTNTVMLKMAMKVGYKIIGVKCWQGTVLLEHVLEF